jgi:hypothetical protein
VSHPLRWDPELTKIRSGPSIIHDPLRTSLAVTAIILAIGAVQPWAEGFIGFLPKKFGGFEGASDGLILLVLAGILVFIARDRGFIRAADGARRWTPMIIGLICLADWIIGRQQAEFSIGRWVDQGGRGALTPGLYIAGVGALGVAVVTSFAALRHHEGESGGPASLVRLPRRSDIPTLTTVIGAILGAGLGVALAAAIVPPVAVGGLSIFTAGFGIVAGGYLGRAIGRWLS